jgi:hypothetical protein
MTEIRCRPIDEWHSPRTQPWDRRRPQYDAGWARTLNNLGQELDSIEADDIVLGLDLLPADIRLDGWPRSSAKPPPPVSLTFTSKYGPKRFECDRFDDWRQNVRAIGLTLQRLRLVDEGGCTRSGEQYVGFGALPPGQPIAVDAAMTAEDAARFIVRHSWPGEADDAQERWFRRLITEPDMLASEYRRAARNLHPDAGGDPALFRRLTEARDLLEATR